MLSECANLQSRQFVRGLILISALLWLFQLSAQASQSVTLNWDPRGNANVVGYKIYYGTTSGSYNRVLAVGPTTTTTISGLADGTTYYFVATVVDGSGNESDFSNETTFVASAVTTVAPTMSAVAVAGGQFGFVVSGVLGRTYVVQASTDLVNWVAVQTNTAPFTFVDPNTASYSKRFYRTFTTAP